MFASTRATRRATVQAGARWTDLLPLADAHGLAGLPGSSPHVGIVGYTLGGGFGWLGRAFGLSSHHVTRARVVTADGEIIVASDTENADLFWGLRGGTGNFGIVTELELGLVALDEVYAGNLFYPLERAADVLAAFARWAPTTPNELTAAVTFRAFPPLPAVPEPLRGNRFVLIRGAYAGSPATVRRLVDEVRAALGPALMDTFGPMRPAHLGAVSMDPVDPLAAEGHTDLLRDITPELTDALVALEGPWLTPGHARDAAGRRRARRSPRRPQPDGPHVRGIHPQRDRPDSRPGAAAGRARAPRPGRRRRSAGGHRRRIPQLPRRRARRPRRGSTRPTRRPTGPGWPGSSAGTTRDNVFRFNRNVTHTEGHQP